jgi:hypothetical protein
MRILTLTVLLVCLCVAPAQEVADKKLKDAVKDAIKEPEKVKEKPKEGSVILNLTVPKDCKIIVNEKAITYEKFEVLMEYTINAFVIEEMAYRNGQFTALKMRSKE